MAPIRRYLRITKYSVLECRIYLDNPALAQSWLLNPRNPVLPRVVESIRPLVLPKLREENERAKGKGGKKKSVKDVVVEEDFEVSIFLTETTTRHSLLTKQKHFRKKEPLKSNSNKLLGGHVGAPIAVEDAPVILREESDDGPVALHDLPSIEEAESGNDENLRRSKRSRATQEEQDDSDDGLFVAQDDPPSKRQKDDTSIEPEEDDKKKLAMDTSYDGFSIYGRVLCLVIKRRDIGKSKATVMDGAQAMMEDWITSTQMPAAEEDG